MNSQVTVGVPADAPLEVRSARSSTIRSKITTGVVVAALGIYAVFGFTVATRGKMPQVSLQTLGMLASLMAGGLTGLDNEPV